MVVMIAIIFIAIILWAVWSCRKDDIGETMETYRDPETEDTLQRLETYRHYVERLDTLRNLNSITDEEYADLKKVVEDKVAELESRYLNE